MTVDQGSVGVESVIARHTVIRSLYLAPAMIIIFGLLRGWDGAWSAALGVAVVVLNFLLSGAILSISARISLQAYHAAALIGFFLRLGLFVGAVYVIASVLEVDRPAFGISAVIAYFALLTLEAVAISQGRERELS
ncbi:MAG TPA: ATP synthase subunit I [Acidimicrobiia bacterium]|nr:ATP synthase subunit I [Acidimicrobiia bacterium]